MITPSPSPDLGIRFIVEPSSTKLTPNEWLELSDLKPAGIMLRKRNFRRDLSYLDWLAVYKDLIDDCRTAIGRTEIIVSIDHEGGAVNRLPEPFTRFPYAATYGSQPEAVFEVSSAMGEELSSLGINISFSPVADIHSNPKNPVINERAYSNDPQKVINAALACARGLRQHGIIPCAKHFPGHGDTQSDSHFDLPVVPYTSEELASRELAPFKALIDDGIEMIMSAHLMIPALDRINQATISKAIMTDLLRHRLGFSGVTIADALGMHGILSQVRSGEFTVLADRAGLDLFLVVGDTVGIGDALRLRDEFQRAIDGGGGAEGGGVEIAQVLATQARLERFIKPLSQHPVKALSESVFNRNRTLSSTLAKNAPWSRFDFKPLGFD